MRIITIILDSLFPPRPKEKLLRTVSELPLTPNVHAGTIFLSSFEYPTVKAAVTEQKFHHNQKAEQLLADLLTKWLQQQTGPIVLVPVPLSKKRLKERGYNQVSAVLKRVTLADVHVFENVVTRIKDTIPQTSLNKDERLKNVQGVFAVSNAETLKVLKNTTVVVIDDVVTTGATVGAVRATLAPHLPASNTLITLALAH